MPALHEPGILLVFSRITNTEALTPDTYNDWYNLIHIPEILNTSGISNATRFLIDGDEHEEYPYLALYEVPDMNFLESKEFKSIAIHHEMLPGPSNSIIDVATFDFRRYKRVYELDKGNGLRQANTCLIFLLFELPYEEEEAHAWVRNHIMAPVAASTDQMNAQFHVRWRSISGTYALSKTIQNERAEYLVLYRGFKELANTLRRYAPSEATISIYAQL